MASLKNFSVKNLKSFVGMEGPAYQATLYFDNKRIGFWSQDGDGSICDNFSFDDSFWLKKLEEVSNGLFPESTIPKEMFMEELLNLTLKEKDYKKITKGSFATVAMVSHPNYWKEMIFTFPDGTKNEEIIQQAKADFFKTVMEENTKFSTEDIVVEIYKSLKDFCK